MSRHFGLLVYENTGNLGDEIQSLAARAFLPRVDRFMERERLHTFQSPDNTQTAVILNGWFMHHPENWPPAEGIWPLLISFHVSDWKNMGFGLGLRAQDTIMAEPFVKYLRGFGPVGARDPFTLGLLQKAGVESYLSGCVTLTLNRPEVEAREDLIVVNDVSPGTADFIRKNSTKEVIITAHSQFSDVEPELRFAEAERLLALYASASCVVTSRLHCALPCLAFGTPVLLLNATNDLNRFAGFLQYLHHCAETDFVNGKYNFDFNTPPKNSENFLGMRNELRRSIERFIGIVSSKGNPPPPYPLTTADKISAVRFVQNKATSLLNDERRLLNQLRQSLTGESAIQSTPECIVRELYRGILNREPDPTWLKKHAEKLKAGGIEGNLSSLIKYFLTSDEYLASTVTTNG